MEENGSSSKRKFKFKRKENLNNWKRQSIHLDGIAKHYKVEISFLYNL